MEKKKQIKKPKKVQFIKQPTGYGFANSPGDVVDIDIFEKVLFEKLLELEIIRYV